MWKGTRSAIVTGCRDSAKPLMHRTLLAAQPWQCCPGQVLLLCLAECNSVHKPPTWWVNIMVLGDKWICVKGAAQKLVGKVSGVVQLVRQSKYMTFTDSLVIVTCSCYICKQSLCGAWICWGNPTVVVNTSTRRDILLIFWTGKSYEKDIFLEGREKRLIA